MKKLPLLDDLDIKILEIFYNFGEDKEKNPTTWQVMKELFPNAKDERERRFKHILIKKRMHRMNDKLFFIEKDKNGFYEYTLIKDNVKFCKRKFPCGLRNCVMINLNEKWIIKQL